MEFNEKLQKLRKQKGITQEELAQRLYVSRTAVSKWESGRGYPSIDSLKAVAEFYGVTVDALLSGDEILTIAEKDSKQREMNIRNTVFGLLDCSIIMLLFLPLFAHKAGGTVQAVSLLELTGTVTYIKPAYYFTVAVIFLSGIILLTLKNIISFPIRCNMYKLSMFFNTAATVVFIVSHQPYAAVMLLVFFIIKASLFIKWH